MLSRDETVCSRLAGHHLNERVSKAYVFLFGSTWTWSEQQTSLRRPAQHQPSFHNCFSAPELGAVVTGGLHHMLVGAYGLPLAL